MLIPCVSNSECALWYNSVESNNALLGIHPTLRQVPPNRSYFSIIAVFKPNCAQRIAATYPPGPEPIMVTSYLLMILIFNIITNYILCFCWRSSKIDWWQLLLAIIYTFHILFVFTNIIL